MGGDFHDSRLEILIRLATLQDHPWNAHQLLDPFLQRLSMPERDAFWTVQVNAPPMTEATRSGFLCGGVFGPTSRWPIR